MIAESKNIESQTKIRKGNTMRHICPAIGLFFLAPLVAEFLLGNLPATLLIPELFILALLYGCGALLIREVARRAGYGWPTMITFALAYGVVEEGIGTMTLFNPEYMGWHLLNYGYIPALGISPNWTLFVAGLHMVWSISVPIAIMETLAGSRRTTPWLGKTGLYITAGLYILGLIIVTFKSTYTFIISVPQFIGVGITVAVIVLIGILIGRRKIVPRAETTRNAPSPWLVGTFFFVASSVFLLIYAADPYGLSPWLAALQIAPWLATVLYIVLFIGVAALVNYWSRLNGWSNTHRLALAGGALFTYIWHSFLWNNLLPPAYAVSQTVKLASNAIFAVFVVVLFVIATRRLPENNP